MIFQKCKKKFYFCKMKKIFLIPILTLVLASCTKAPSPVYPVPTDNQLAWQQFEMYAFIHLKNSFYGPTVHQTLRTKNEE